MRKYFPVFLVFFILIFIVPSAAAKPEDVKLIPLSRYNYKNVDGYGFYDKCADYSWFGMVLHNETEDSYTITLPNEVRVTGWNGTKHPVANTRYKVMDFGSGNFLREDREELPFSGKLTLPAKSTLAVFMDIKDFSRYNLYWDTNVFFKFQVTDKTQSAEKSVSGILAQRGNACSADQVCTAEVVNGAYNAAGGGEVTVSLKNSMPDAAEITGKTDVVIKWRDANGKTQERTVPNGVKWSSVPGWLGSGEKKTVSGTLSLPVEITSIARELDLTFHFYFPSSLFFGDFYAQKKLSSTTGLQAVFSGNYDTDGKKGAFSAVIYNNEKTAVTLQTTAAAKDLNSDLVPHAIIVKLPAEGKAVSADGKSSVVSLDWYTGNGITIDPGKSVSLEGALSFKDTRLIQSNNSLILSADLGVSGGIQSASAGTITRNPDPNPVLEAVSFCRNYKTGDSKLSFTYTLKNASHIDILTELATTLAIPGQVPNPKIKYTACVSSGASCLSRINGSNITLSAGETASFSGEVVMDPVSRDANITAQTSLRYFPDGEKKVLYVGKTSEKCGTPVTPVVPTVKPSVTPVTPEITVTPVTPEPAPESALSTESFCRVLKDGKSIVFQYALKNNAKNDIKLQLAKTLAVEGQEKTSPIRYLSCEIKGKSGCTISGENYTIKSGETVTFTGEAVPAKVPASKDFSVRTSLIYYDKDGETVAYFIGRTTGSCGSVPVVPTEVPPVTAVLKSEGFCRTMSSDGKKVSFVYTLVNDNKISVPVQLAKSLKVEQQSRNLPITYTKCESGGKDCSSRIKGYDFTMAAGERAAFSGVVTLDNAVSSQNFAAYTSLVYTPGGERKVLDLGDTYTVCPVGKAADDLNGADAFETDAVSEAVVGNAYIDECPDDGRLHFTLKITNSGTADDKIDLSAVSFTANGAALPVSVNSCMLMSGLGADTLGCAAEMAYRILTVGPGTTLSLDFVSDQKISGETLTVTALVPDVTSVPFTFEASAGDSICGAVVNSISAGENGAVNVSVSPAKDAMTLSIRFVNSGSRESVIVPGTIYFTKESLEKYDGVVSIDPLSAQTIESVQKSFTAGKEVLLPAYSSAVFSVSMNVNLAEAFDNSAEFTWHFDADGKPSNHTGAVNFAQKGLSSVQKAVTPVSRSNDAPTIHFYSLGEPQLPKILPATGFAGLHKIFEQPADLKYQELDGLHLEIPVIDAEMDLVRVPLNESNEWAVEWLDDRAGVLSAGSLPGHGTSLIAAHNHLDAENAGPFKMLQYLDEKDRIFVTDNKGQFLSFSVYANELLQPDDGELLYQKAIPGSLVMVTCESELPEGGYAFRRVIYAEPLQ
ncbi:MAG: class F sortase [Anaerolineaceae bacterium]|nr:class F sortase [Anaerolineaceae bacterium]